MDERETNKEQESCEKILQDEEESKYKRKQSSKRRAKTELAESNRPCTVKLSCVQATRNGKSVLEEYI